MKPIGLLCALHQLRSVEILAIFTNFTPCLPFLLQSMTTLAMAPKAIKITFSLGLLKLSKISVNIAWSPFSCKTRHVKRAEIAAICYKLDEEENY